MSLLGGVLSPRAALWGRAGTRWQSVPFSRQCSPIPSRTHYQLCWSPAGACRCPGSPGSGSGSSFWEVYANKAAFFSFFLLIPCCCCSAVSQIAEVLRTGVCIGSCGTRVPASCSAEGSGEGLFQGRGDREQLAEAEDGGMKVL